MSHVVTVDIQVKNLTALRRACKRLGLDFHEGKKTFKWYGRWMNDYHAPQAAATQGFDPKEFGKCEHAMSVSGNANAYEAGIVKHPSGEGYALMWDFFGGQGKALQDVIGADGGKLKQAYAAEVTKMQAEQYGRSYSEQTLKDGSLKLTIQT